MCPDRTKEIEIYMKSQKQTENDSMKSHGKKDIDNNGKDIRESFDTSSYAGLGATEYIFMMVVKEQKVWVMQ